MDLDELIAHLIAVRERHGGGHKVMLGEPDAPPRKTWAGIPLEPQMIHETVAEGSFTDVPGYGVKTGWIWFEIPRGGISQLREIPK